MTYNPLTGVPPEVVKASAKLGLNNTGFTILKATPVRILPDGNLALINPSIETEVDGLAGLTKDNVTSGNTIDVVTSGTIENITTLANFGDVMYISKSGGLTNTKPSIGVNGFVAGDWVVRIGVIAKNQINPLLKDIIVNIQLVGQL